MIVLRLSHSDRRFSRSSILAGSRGLPNSPREKVTVRAHGLEGVGRQLLREQGRCARARGGKSVCQFLPSTSTSPPLGVTIPQTMLISVVLPAPLGPRSAKISPRRMSRSIDLQRVDAGAVGLAQAADREDRVAHSTGPGSAGTASSLHQAVRSSIGMLAAANRKVRGIAPHSLNPIQKSVELLRQTASLRTAMKAKKIAQLRVSLVQPSSSRPGIGAAEHALQQRPVGQQAKGEQAGDERIVERRLHLDEASRRAARW